MIIAKIKALWAYYFKPKSLTWLTGAGGVTVGIASAVRPESVPIQTIAEVVGGLNGVTGDPAMLIVMGLGLMGIGARKGEQG